MNAESAAEVAGAVVDDGVVDKAAQLFAVNHKQPAAIAGRGVMANEVTLQQTAGVTSIPPDVEAAAVGAVVVGNVVEFVDEGAGYAAAIAQGVNAAAVAGSGVGIDVVIFQCVIGAVFLQHAAAVACCGLIVGNGVRDQRAVGSIVHKDAAAFVGGIAQNSVIRHLHIVCFPELERSPFFLRRIFLKDIAADGNLPNSAYYQSTAIVGGIAADGIGLHRYLTDVI